MQKIKLSRWPKHLMTYAEFSKLAGVCESTAYRWRDAGDLASIEGERVGKRLSLGRKEALAWIKTKQKEQESEK